MLALSTLGAAGAELEELQAIRAAVEANTTQAEILNAAVVALQNSSESNLETLYLGILSVVFSFCFFHWIWKALP